MYKKTLIIIIIVLALAVFLPAKSSNQWCLRIWRINIGWFDKDCVGIETYHGTGRVKFAWNYSYGTSIRYIDNKWQEIEEDWPLFGFTKF